jgi:serine/threonine-protein kinase
VSNANNRSPREEGLPELGDDSEDVSFDDDLPQSSTALHVHPRRRSRPPPMFAERYGRDDWPPKPGMLIAEKYRIQRLLAVGGMGVIVVARHEELGNDVAIKFLSPDSMSDADIVARFKREARALATIQSDHVVRVMDVGAMPTGEPFMVMEYLEGTDLAKLVKRRGPLPCDEAVGYVLQACEPLAEAHAAGIVHRDLKPSNLYLARKSDGSQIIKVIDFGISKMVSGAALEGEMSMTRTQAILGSPLYIAPEQLKSARTVDARADIWALGVILHKLITGHPPFMGDTMAQLCAMVLLEPAPAITARRPDAPPGLAQVILKCLEKDPGARYQSVAELAAALMPFAASGTEAAVPRLHEIISQPPPPPARPPVDPSTSGGRLEVGPGLAVGTSGSVPSASWRLAPPAPPPINRAAFASIIVALAILGAALGIFLWKRVVRANVASRSATGDTAVAPVVTVPAIVEPMGSTAATSSSAASSTTSAATTTATASATVTASASSKKQPPRWTPPPPRRSNDNAEFGDRK